MDVSAVCRLWCLHEPEKQTNKNLMLSSEDNKHTFQLEIKRIVQDKVQIVYSVERLYRFNCYFWIMAMYDVYT